MYLKYHLIKWFNNMYQFKYYNQYLNDSSFLTIMITLLNVFEIIQRGNVYKLTKLDISDVVFENKSSFISPWKQISISLYYYIATPLHRILNNKKTICIIRHNMMKLLYIRLHVSRRLYTAFSIKLFSMSVCSE